MIFITWTGSGTLSRYTVEETDIPELKREGLDEQDAIAAVVMLATAFNDNIIYTRIPDLGLIVSMRIDVQRLAMLAEAAGVRKRLKGEGG